MFIYYFHNSYLVRFYILTLNSILITAFIILSIRRRGGLLRYPCLSVCVSVRLSHRSFISNYSSQMLESYHTLCFGMLNGGIHFCWNTVSTSCLSDRLSVPNFCSSFHSNYSRQLLEILAHSLFWHAIWWDLFFVQIWWQLPVYLSVFRIISIAFFSALHVRMVGAWTISTLFVLAFHTCVYSHKNIFIYITAGVLLVSLGAHTSCLC